LFSIRVHRRLSAADFLSQALTVAVGIGKRSALVKTAAPKQRPSGSGCARFTEPPMRVHLRPKMFFSQLLRQRFLFL
jgi:hypothetical protein